MKKLFDNYKNLSIAVLGDYYLDEYFRIDAALNEPSLETGLVAYQCVKCETFPGASGNITKNLANFGVGCVYAVGFTGDDGRGMEMRRNLKALGINMDNLITYPGRITPTHTKPWLTENGETRELNRIDIKNWTITPTDLEDAILDRVRALIKNIDALIVLDHAAEANLGIITDRVRDELAKIAQDNPKCVMFADSRGRIGKFNNMIIKGNQFELCHAVYGQAKSTAQTGSVALAADPFVTRTDDEIVKACTTLYEKTGCPVVCTLGENGAKIYTNTITNVPGVHVSGAMDVCGAGDMFTSAFVSALAAGANMEEAGRLGNIAAAMCVRQLGTTGHVTPQDISDAWDIEVVNLPDSGGFKFALFDFDGTVSLLREGWREIMIPYFAEEILKTDPAADVDETESLVADFVDELTGKQTIFQCIRLAEEVGKRSGTALPAGEYKAEYLRRLMERIKSRHEALKNGTEKPKDHLVPGSVEFLSLLRDSGVNVYLASGTDEDDVIAEAKLLGVDKFFNGGIYGARDDMKDCSKELVIRQIIEENKIQGKDIISFGDGYVEVQLVHEIGGYTVAVATNEEKRKGVNPWKRERLLRAGADAVVADFSDTQKLFEFINN